MTEADAPEPESAGGPGADEHGSSARGATPVSGSGRASRSRQRKQVLLRLDPAIYEALARWAGEELRSTNAQIDFLLRRALTEAGRLPSQARPHPKRGRPPRERREGHEDRPESEGQQESEDRQEQEG